jgi:hypothetical protein
VDAARRVLFVTKAITRVNRRGDDLIFIVSGGTR